MPLQWVNRGEVNRAFAGIGMLTGHTRSHLSRFLFVPAEISERFSNALCVYQRFVSFKGDYEPNGVLPQRRGRIRQEFEVPASEIKPMLRQSQSKHQIRCWE